MQYGWRLLMVAVMLAATCLAVDPPKRAGSRTLPAIQMSDSNGTEVNFADLGLSGHWLLVYVQAKNPSTQMVIEQLKSDQFRSYAGQFVIVVGGMKPDELAIFTKQFPELSASRWIADTTHAAMRGLDLHGFPVQLGMRDNGVEWQLNGAGQGNEMFEATMLNWLKRSN